MAGKPKKWGPEIRAAVVDRVSAGVSLPDTANALGLRVPTLKGWLTRGRREGDGEYAEFAYAVDQAREDAKKRPDPMDGGELLRVVSHAARKGSVQAMKLRWEMLCADRNATKAAEVEGSAGPLAGIDQLAERRAA